MTTQQNASSPLAFWQLHFGCQAVWHLRGNSPFRGFIIALSRGAPATRGNESERPTVTEPPLSSTPARASSRMNTYHALHAKTNPPGTGWRAPRRRARTRVRTRHPRSIHPRRPQPRTPSTTGRTLPRVLLPVTDGPPAHRTGRSSSSQRRNPRRRRFLFPNRTQPPPRVRRPRGGVGHPRGVAILCRWKSSFACVRSRCASTRIRRSISLTASGVSSAGSGSERPRAEDANPAASLDFLIAAAVVGAPGRPSIPTPFALAGGSIAGRPSTLALSATGFFASAEATHTTCAAGDHATSLTRTPRVSAAGTRTPSPPMSTSKSLVDPSAAGATANLPSGETPNLASCGPRPSSRS